MVTRQFWQQAIESAWLERPVVWLTGVRRVGKTTLVRSLPDSRYFDCELPRIRRQMEEDPEGFLQEQGTAASFSTRFTAFKTHPSCSKSPQITSRSFESWPLDPQP